VFGDADHAPLLMGLEYEKEDGSLASTLLFGAQSVPANFSLERHTRSAFAEGQFSLHERLTVHAGMRVDSTSGHGTHTSVHTGLRYRMNASGTSLALNAGTGYKPPSFFALGHPLVGNVICVPRKAAPSNSHWPTMMRVNQLGSAWRYSTRATRTSSILMQVHRRNSSIGATLLSKASRIRERLHSLKK
jgi:outer membrane cobalamin receptor